MRGKLGWAGGGGKRGGEDTEERNVFTTESAENTEERQYLTTESAENTEGRIGEGALILWAAHRSDMEETGYERFHDA
jgi:hypothetical protein